MDLGPIPVWDTTGGPAMKPPPARGSGLQVEEGKLNKVIWMCWTGNNPMPAHLQLCFQTIKRNSGLPVILVTPDNVLEYVPDPHPAYPYLHLAHRADYLRCYLLHTYGGIYLDVDTICLRSLAGLFDLLDRFDAVGYDGSIWNEYIGISDMGPFNPDSELSALWFNALHGKLEKRLPDLQAQQTDVFYWQEILRDIFLPVSLIHSNKISKGLTALNPDQAQLWSTQLCDQVLGSPVHDSHILILNNSKYGNQLNNLTEEQILSGPAVLSQLLRRALGVPDPD